MFRAFHITTAAALALLMMGCAGAGAVSTVPLTSAARCTAQSDGSAAATSVASTLATEKSTYGLNAIIFSALRGTTPIVTTAIGESTPGVPATTAMHFRVGMPAEQFEATLALQLADQNALSLDAPLSTWFPTFPGAAQATVRMAGYSTTGFGDYVYGPANPALGIPAFGDVVDQNPFQTYTSDQLIARGAPPYQVAKFTPPGSAWDYSHTNYVMLGSLVQTVAHTPYAALAQTRLFDRLGMRDTVIPDGAAVAEPVLHAFTTERGPYEDSTLWSPSWTSYSGNANSTVCDLGVWTNAFGTGALVSPQSAAVVTAPVTANLHVPFSSALYFGFGVIVANGWLYSSGNFFGWHTATAYYPPTQTTLVVTATTAANATNNDKVIQFILTDVSKQLVPNAPLVFPPGS